MYRISGIIQYPARKSGKKRYLVLSGILYPVESLIWYYPVHYQLLPNTAATDFYGIYNFLVIKCTLNQWFSDIKLTWETLPGIIRHYPESGIL